MVELSRGTLIFNQARKQGRAQAIIAGTAVVLCVLSFAALFPDASLGAFHVWEVSPTFNHCFLVLPISLFLIWYRRNSLVGVTPEREFLAAAAIPLLGFAWLGASETGILEAQQLIVVTMIQATLWATLGTAFYRKLAAPLLYLYFLVPSGAFLVPALQSFTAHFAVAGLHLLGIPVFSNGAVIEIPAGTFAVAEACAGLRFLVAALAFGVFFAVITYRSWWRRSAFIALSIVVPLIANGLRALGLIAAAEWIGNPAAALADHIIYGWIFFSFVLVMLVLLGNLFSDRHTEDAAPPASAPVTVRRSGWIGIVAAIGACFLAAVFGPVTADFLDVSGTSFLPKTAPAVAPPWQQLVDRDGWAPLVADPARSFLQSFVRGPDRIDRFIALYAGEGRRNNAARLNNRDADERAWSFDSSRQRVLEAGGRTTVPVVESIWLRGGDKRFVWSFYVVDGRFASNIWTAKWDQFRAYVTANKCLSAYVALSADASDVASAAKAAGDLLAASENLGSYLCGATRVQKQGGTQDNSTRRRHPE